MKIYILLISLAVNFNLLSQDYYDNRLFVKLKESTPTDFSITLNSELANILAKENVYSIRKAFISKELSTIYEIKFEKKINLIKLISKIEKLTFIEYAERIPIYKLFLTPNDPQYTSQWNLAKIQADLAWNLSTGCSSIKVAITDDGFLMNHEDLVSQWYINPLEFGGIAGIDDDGNGYIDDWRGWDAANNDNDPSAFNPTNSYFTHGTHVAGIAGAATNNSLGIASIGFNNKLIPVKIGRDLDGALTGAYQGLDYAINASGCDVINMSWGGGGVSATYQILFNLAYTKGIICVAAAGNSSLNTATSPMYPAAYNHVISVAASTITDAKAGFSNYGTNIDVTAPGSNILSCLAGGVSNYGNLSGTSMASPLVAGLCGLMKCYNPMPVDSIEACLKRTCDNINTQNPSFIGQIGAGRINSFQALQCLAQKPVTDFYSRDTNQCVGKQVRFFATSFGVAPLTYSWSFPGGSPPTSTFQNPLVTYATNGVYSATLTTTNALGSHTVSKTNYVTIAPPTATLKGRKYTSYNSNAVIITVSFKGNPPYNVTLTDGTNNFTKNNITSNPYYFSIVPIKDTSLITISSFSDTQCVGTKLGQDTIYRITLSNGGGTTYCESSFKFDKVNLNSNQVIQINNYNGDLYDKNGFTWEAWFKLNQNSSSMTSDQAIIAATDTQFFKDIFLGFQFGSYWGARPVGLNVCVSSYIWNSKPISKDTWNHVALVCDYSGQKIRLYLNGIKIDSTSISMALIDRMGGTGNDIPVTIGNIRIPSTIQSWGLANFDGKIDEVRFWNKVKTTSEIVADMKTCLPSTTPNLIAYYKGDEGTGSIANNKMSSNYIGTLFNGASWSNQVDSVKNCTICSPITDCDTTNLNSGLVLNLDFNGNTLDKSGNANHATNFGATAVAGKLGIVNTAYKFNGSSDYMKVLNSTSLSFDTNYTVTAKIKIDGFNSDPCRANCIFFKGHSVNVATNPHFDWTYSPNAYTGSCSAPLDVIHQNLYVSSLTSTGYNVYNPYFVPNKWYCFVMVQKKDTAYTYIDGIQVHKQYNSFNGGKNNYDIYLGKTTYATLPYLINATYDEIRVYNRSLATSEVKGYCGTCTVVQPPIDCDTTNLNTGLVLNLPFNGNTLDVSGNGNHATNNGATPVAGKAGIANTAYRFDSTNFMSVAHNATLNLRSFTLTAIVNPLKFNTDVCFTNNVINKGTVSTGAQWAMQYAPTTSTTCFNRDTSECNMILCGSSCPPSNSITNTTPYMVHNKWECAVLTYDSVTKDVKMYMNGVFRHQWNATFNSLFSQNTANVFIGKYNDPTYPGYLQGIIDDIRIYNRVLAPSEVKGYCGSCLLPQTCKYVNNTSCWVKDAAVSTYTPNTNYSTHPENLAASWTCSGSPCQARSFFDFNLSEIPTNAVIESANLYLYAVPNSTNNGYTGQPTYGSNNASVIQRIIQPWNETTVTWTNKPNTTTVNQATLTQSTGLLQNYVVDMKNLIIDHRANSSSSYGFMLKHIAEGTSLNSMIFGSTDNPNPSLRPKLEICYSVPNGNPIYASPPAECDSSCNTWLKSTNSSDRVTIGDLDISGNQVTLEAWVNNIDTSTDPTWEGREVISKHSGPNDINYNLRSTFTSITTDSSLLLPGVYKFYYTPIICKSNLNKTYHIASVYDGSTLKFYRNGYLMSQVSAKGNLILNNFQTTIGNYAAGNSFPTKGYLNEVRIWNVARTQAQLKSFMNITLPNPSTQSGLLAYYTFDNLLNKQGNAAYNGTLGGGALINQTNPNCSLNIDSCGQIISLPPIKCDSAKKFIYTKCTNDSLQLNIRQGSKYQWSPTIGLTSDTVRNPKCFVKSKTTYLVLYSDTNGCQLVDTVIVNVNSPANYLPLDDQLICQGDSVQMTIPIYATGISWTPNSNISNPISKNPYFFPTSSTTYYLQYTDTFGCTQRDTFIINTKLCCTVRARFTMPDMLCFGSKLSINNTSKGPITSTNWNYTNGNPSSAATYYPPLVSYSAGGPFPVRLIVSNGICSDTMTKNLYVVKITPFAGRDTTNCLANFTTELGEVGLSDWRYSWSPATYLSDPSSPNPICSIVNDSVTYILEATDKSTGCKGYDTVVVKTNQNIISKVASNRICKGDSFLFNNIQYKTTGRYFYTVKKKNSICDSFISIQNLDVLSPITTLNSPEIHCYFYIDKKGKRQDTNYIRRDTIRSKSMITCDSLRYITPIEIYKPIYKSLTITACKEVIYNGKRYTESKNNIDSTKITGPYSGCDSIITRINAVVKPIPNATITASKPNIVQFGDTVVLKAGGGGTYLWLHNNSTDSSIWHQSVDSAYHTYIVRVTDTNKCWETAMYTIKGRMPDTLYYGIPNIFSPNNDGKNDVFIPNMNFGVKMLDFFVWNRWGEKMWESHDNKGWDGYYKNKPAPASVYVYYVMFQTPWGKREYKGSFTLIR
jgi:gliding motility-associated-like protein